MAQSPEAVSRKHRRVPWWGWLLRGIGCLFGLLLTIFAGLLIFYFAVVAPRERARQAEVGRKAAAFARLNGPARQLAIYDAFVAAVDEHYYDQTFAGFDWPRLKREWRPRAAAARNEFDLYFSIFLPMSQAFPVSHIGASPPERPQKSSGASPASRTISDEDVGAQLLWGGIRRGKGMIGLVGEVLPGSPAAKAGIQPGSVIQTAKLTSDGRGSGRIFAKLFCLTPAEAHLLEHGSTKLNVPLAAHACQALPARQMTVTYDFAYQGARPEIVVRRLATGALYIRFDAFQHSILAKVVAALRTADERGVIIDLRFNHGGYVDPLLDALFPASRPVYRRRLAGVLSTVSTPMEGFRYLGPLVLLTGPSSASAAEVTAAVVKSQHRGPIVGRATNGSVLGADYFDLPDGGKVQVPVESIETLDGRPLEGAGIMPDIEIYPTLAELRAGKDPALERAEAILGRAAAIRH